MTAAWQAGIFCMVPPFLFKVNKIRNGSRAASKAANGHDAGQKNRTGSEKKTMINQRFPEII